MDTNALLYQIALPLLPEVGLHWGRELVSRAGSAEAVFKMSKGELLGLHMNPHAVEALLPRRAAALERAKKEVAFVEKHQIKALWYEDEEYPERLRQIPDAPLMVYTKGNIHFDGHFVSVVGTREPSDRGKQLCHDFVLDLAKHIPDITIVSGLAYGIDICAHRAALEAGVPTIVVPAHGLDRVYPMAHRNTAVQALEKGGILTEYMSETNPDKQNFVARNRIVAGLSEATIVVESKSKGGSLITASLALDYNRDVFAFPGRPTDTSSLGCNNLIRKQIAGLINSADDFIDAMGWERQQPQQTSMEEALFADLSPEEEIIVNLLRQNEEGLHINSICDETDLPFSSIASLLLTLELKGIVRPLPGSRYRAS